MYKDLRKIMQFLSLFAVALLLGACGKSAENNYQPSLAAKSDHEVREYVVGIFPVSNPQRLTEMYGPIVEYINSQISEASFKMETARNFEEFEKNLYAGHFDFALLNPYQTLQSLKYEYRIIAKMGDDENFRGVILVRKDSHIHEIKDLKGKVVSYPAVSALAGTMMPQYYLQTHGLDVNRDIKNIYVGSQESSIMNVLRGRVAAGTAWLVPWKNFVAEHPEMADQLVAKWQTEHLLDNGWVVRKEIPATISNKFARLLANMHKNEPGKTLLQPLQLSHFDLATEQDYLPVHDFLEKYSRIVRPIEH